MASYHIETSADGGLTWRGHGELAPATKREAVKMAQQMLSLLPTQQARILAVYKAKYRGVAIVWTGEPKKPTVAAVKAHCKALGLSCRRVDGEYRIAWAGDEASGPLATWRRPQSSRDCAAAVSARAPFDFIGSRALRR